MDELKDHNRRKCNLIVHKLPEGSNDDETFLSICKDVLGLDVKIISFKRLDPIFICSYYRPPNSMQHSLLQLQESLNKVLSNSIQFPNIILAGDLE